MRFGKIAIVRVLHEEPKFSEMFLSYIFARNARVEADLVDQLFNSSEKRLARLLLLMANFGKEGPRADHSEGQSGDVRRNGRHDAVAREFFYEQVPQAWLRLQRPPQDSQLLAEQDSSRRSLKRSHGTDRGPQTSSESAATSKNESSLEKVTAADTAT
jgi:hypothetical protein